jgi:ATP-dependent RNA helicase RhlE
VNFDVPNTPDAYTHRIGRTGRSEQTGTAFTFVTPADAAGVRAIEQRLGSPIERRDLAELGSIARTALAGRKGRRRVPPVAARKELSKRGKRNARRLQPRPVRSSATPAAARPEPPQRPAFGAGVHDTPPRERGSKPAKGPRPARSSSQPARRRRRRRA